MGKLLAFLFFLGLVGAVVWQAVGLVYDPSSRTIGRFVFVVAVGATLLAMLVIGVTQ